MDMLIKSLELMIGGNCFQKVLRVRLIDGENTLQNEIIDYSLLSEKHFLVKEISALKNKNLEESIRWLFNSMTDQEKTK